VQEDSKDYVELLEIPERDMLLVAGDSGKC